MGVGFAALFAVAVVAAVIALDQRSEAQKQAKTSLTRQLAATSDSLAERDLDVSLLMAVQAYENEPNAAALGALIQANTASPKLVRFLHTGSTVAQIAASGDGKTGVAGLDDGRVVRFPVREAGGELEEVMDLGAAITSLAVSRDGATIAASDGEGAFVSSGGQDGGEQTELVITEGLLADVVGLSPSGDVVVVHGNPDAIDAEESVWSFDTTGDELHAPFGLGELTTVSTIIARSDSDITIFTGYGEWQERQLSDAFIGESDLIGIGQERPGYPSADGAFWTKSGGVEPVGVWAVGGEADVANPEYTAEIALEATPSALTLSARGGHVAAADAGIIHVAPVAPPNEARPAAIELDGGGAVNSGADTSGEQSGALRFAGDDDHLISASNERLAIWDLRQVDRLATVSRVALGTGCGACGPPRVAVSRDGTEVAMSVEGESFDTPAIVRPLGEEAGPDDAVAMPPGSFAEPIWIDGGPDVALPFTGPAGRERDPSGEGVNAWPIGDTGAVVRAVGIGPDPGTVVTVNADGAIAVRDGADGDVLDEIPGFEKLDDVQEQISDAAVDGSGTLIARLNLEEVTFTSLDDEQAPGPIDVPGATGVSFSGGKLLIRFDDNRLEVRDPESGEVDREVAGDASFFIEPIGNADGSLLAQRRTDGAVQLVGLADGAALGTLAIPEDADTNKTGVAFSGDGGKLVTVTEDVSELGDYMVERDISPDGLIDAACAAAGRSLTEEEWNRLVGVELPERLACAP